MPTKFCLEILNSSDIHPHSGKNIGYPISTYAIKNTLNYSLDKNYIYNKNKINYTILLSL